MDLARYNNQTLEANKIAKSVFSREEDIRILSANGELRCLDPECTVPVKYCHGPKKQPYFSHIKKATCQYSSYYKMFPKHIHSIICDLGLSLLQQGYEIDLYAKVISRHITPIVLKLKDGSTIAIELGHSYTMPEIMNNLHNKYLVSNIHLRWLVISDELYPKSETNTYYPYRQQLNKSDNNCVLVVSKDGSRVVQTLFYQQANSNNELFSYEGTIKDIMIDNHCLTLKGFANECSKWLQGKEKFHQYDTIPQEGMKILINTGYYGNAFYGICTIVKVHTFHGNISVTLEKNNCYSNQIDWYGLCKFAKIKILE